MTRLHLRIESDSFLQSQIIPVREMLAKKPWDQSPEDRAAIATDFFRDTHITSGLSVPPPVAVFDRNHAAFNAVSLRTPYRIAERHQTSLGLRTESDKIVFRFWNTVEVVAAFYEWIYSEVGFDTDAALETACSLIYTVRPVFFRAAVRKGLVRDMCARDTYTTAAWENMVEANLVSGQDLLFPPDVCAYFLEHGEFPEDAEDEEDAYEGISDADFEDEEVEVEDTPEDDDEATIADRLGDLGISQLRKVSRGAVSGGYSMKKETLISAICSSDLSDSEILTRIQENQ